MNNTQDKKSGKEMINEMKIALKTAIRDKKRWLICLTEILIAGVLLAIDLLTKHFIYGECKANGRINIIEGVICFEAVENTGASFGIFQGNTLSLAIVSLVCAAVLLIFLFYSYKRRNLWLRSALILILAGATGNIIDRLALGYVRDFVYFELIDFAVFNFADSCLTVGTIVLIIYVLFFYSKEEKELQEKKKKEKAALTAESATSDVTNAGADSVKMESEGSEDKSENSEANESITVKDGKKEEEAITEERKTAECKDKETSGTEENNG